MKLQEFSSMPTSHINNNNQHISMQLMPMPSPKETKGEALTTRTTVSSLEESRLSSSVNIQHGISFVIVLCMLWIRGVMGIVVVSGFTLCYDGLFQEDPLNHIFGGQCMLLKIPLGTAVSHCL